MRAGPGLQRALHSGGPGILETLRDTPDRAAARRRSDWSAYVESFVKSHALNAEQATAARGILNDCVAKARAYLEAHEPEMRALASEIETAIAFRALSPAERRKKLLSPLKSRKPIDAIFDHQLKPRLEALLTADQRRAAAPPSTQPGR